jgi:dihydroorotate dehydrogenase (fumarate)
LAGATTVQVCSAVYKGGVSVIGQILSDLDAWMGEKGFSGISDFKGKMNYASVLEPQIYERAQFMKYFSNME